MPIFLVSVVFFGITLNLAGAVDFFKNRRPKTPLSITVVHLYALNILLALTQPMMNSISSFFPGRSGWLWGNRVCDLYLLANIMLNCLILNSHGLLALNRTWAILSPFTYRRLVSRKLSLQVIAGLWVYVVLPEFPFWPMDAVEYRKPVEKFSCMINANAQPVYNSIAQLVHYTFPVGVVWVAFVVVILHKIGRRSKLTSVNPVIASASDTGATAAITAGTHARREQVPCSVIIGPGRKTAKEREARSFVVLTILTVGVTVCYGPHTVFAALRNFAVSIEESPSFRQTVGIMVSCQVVLDPVLLIWTLRNANCRKKTGAIEH
ncbi:hypothetical protein BV898_08957 [Hypsibius exemplaris]|uniref:G-protein coupled receptors family 1 profile domain-containing protein n=1 Tax=Hypsibius exemplaris TaxID=2072580 RepID=A0A1W0WP44_HYPEX|nr:hypothetical protein BV898_08957 [Hypsibius exemplaris]